MIINSSIYLFLLTVPVILDTSCNFNIKRHVQDLRTVIVTADIHQGLYQTALLPPIFDLLALVRRHPVYIILRFRTELCFW